MTAKPLQQRADDVLTLVAKHAQSKQSGAAEVLYSQALSAAQGLADSLEASSATIAALPGTKASFSRTKAAVKVLATTSSAWQSDPISFIQAPEAKKLSSALAAANVELSQESASRWEHLRDSLTSQYPGEFVQALARIAAFRADATAVIEAWEVLERARAWQNPDAAMIERARNARKRVDEGLEKLNARITSPEVRKLLSRAVNGNLPLTQVTPEFIEWIRSSDLETTFRVSVR